MVVHHLFFMNCTGRLVLCEAVEIGMPAYLKNIKAMIMGGVVTSLLSFLLVMDGFFLISPEAIAHPLQVVLNVLAFLISWLVLAYLFDKYPFYRTLGVIALLLAAGLVENLMRMPINPVTISLIILFWIGVASLITPQFYQKYRILIFSVYGLVMAYFLLFRMMPNYLEDHHQNFIRFLIFPLPVFACLWGYEQWRWLRTLQTEKTQTELSLLKNQINPHFFFNTLNNLYGLAVEKSDLAPEMILKLSDLMRYTIYEANEEQVPLAHEVRYLEDFISLHQIRYQKQVEISFLKEISHHHKIAPLLLIVPLENAVKHGIESLSENAFVHLEVNTTPGQICFRIQNNYEPDQVETGGIGLANLKKRLILLYPNRHVLDIQQTTDTYTLTLTIDVE